MPATADIFPAEIFLTPPEGKPVYVGNPARILITPDRVIIAKDENQGPVVVYSQAIDPSTFYQNPTKTEKSQVYTDNGTLVEFRKDTACGCGSRLRSWNPYGTAGLSSSKDPTE